MASTDEDLSSLLIFCLSCILRVNPMVVTVTNAMQLTFYFFTHNPENPICQFTLCETLENFILPSLRTAEDEHTSFAELRIQWLSKAIEMLNLASQRSKGDPLITVNSTCDGD